MAIGSAFDAFSSGLEDWAKKPEVNAVAGLNKKSIFVEGKFFADEELEHSIQVFTQTLGKVGVWQRGVLGGIFTAGERGKLRSVGAQVDGRDGKCSSGHGVSLLE